MENLFKKFIYTGVGMVSLTVKKFDEVISRLVEEGKLSENEGRDIVDDFRKETRKSRDELEKDWKDVVRQVLQKMDIPTKADFERLERRVAALEMEQRQPAKTGTIPNTGTTGGVGEAPTKSGGTKAGTTNPGPGTGNMPGPH